MGAESRINLTKVTKSLEHSPVWETNKSSATQEIPRFYETQMCITAFTRIRHLSLSWAKSIQSTSQSHF
jgi:hypothetical protein